MPVCQDFFCQSSFYQQLFELDQAIAAAVRQAGCPYCSGRLHVADYPRKPRGLREPLTADYQRRLSFCCAHDDCRRRTTPPSVRFLGRKVYLGVIVILVSALQHGLTDRRRRQLIEQLDLWPQTIARWRRWWREGFAASRCWQALRARFIPPIADNALPGAALGRLSGADLAERVRHWLGWLAPVTTTAWAGSLLDVRRPQKM
jgi:hypothetical protein